MTKQGENASRCVSLVMKLANKIFGGNLKEKTYIQDYRESFGESIRRDGVDPGKWSGFVEGYFNCIPFTSFQNAINNHYLVMICIETYPVPHPDSRVVFHYTENDKSLHCMLVVGYQPNGYLIVMDPNTGGQRTISPSEVLPNYIKVITGNK